VHREELVGVHGVWVSKVNSFVFKWATIALPP
jgi:hypothetical protein